MRPARQLHDLLHVGSPVSTFVRAPTSADAQYGALQEDITNVDLDGVLPSATIMVVSVTASTTAGQPLPDAEIEQVPFGGNLLRPCSLEYVKRLPIHGA